MHIAMDDQNAMAYDVDMNFYGPVHLQLSLQNLIYTEDNHISSAPHTPAASCRLVQRLIC